MTAGFRGAPEPASTEAPITFALKRSGKPSNHWLLTAMLVIAGGLLAFLVWGLMQWDLAREQREREAVRAFLDAHTQHMVQALKAAASNAENPAPSGGALSEAWFQQAFGRPLNDTFGFEQNFLLDQDGQVLYASSSGQSLSPGALEDMKPALRQIVQQAQAQKEASGVVSQGKLSGLAAVRAVTVSRAPGTQTAGGAGPVYAVTVDLLNQDLFRELGQNFNAGAFHLQEGAGPTTTTLALRDMVDGRPISITWPEDRPGLTFLKQVAPPVALLSTFLLAMCVLMLREARRSAAALAESEAQATILASQDTLTGLANRAQVLAQLQNVLMDLPPERGVALMFVDLDSFKDINDTLGHAAGDTLLRTVGDRLSACAAPSGLAGRIGGDEFVLLMPFAHAREVDGIVAAVFRSLEQTISIDGAELGVSASIGIALAPHDATYGDDLMRRADMALYRAKHMGRSAAVRFQPHFERELQHRLTLETELAEALERGQFSMVYQPQVDLETRRIVGLEALVRWNHPQRGRLLPGEFLWVAEGTRLITRIDAWVLRHACLEAKAFGGISLAVNMSPVNLRYPGMAERILDVLRETGFPPERLEIELTESAMLDSGRDVKETLDRLRAHGVRLALDDFGTGHASLLHVRNFPVTKIKIDRSFIANLGVERDAASIVEHVIRLGRSLGITLTAEGVDNLEQVRFLRAFGAQQAQGFLFSAPLPAAAAADLVAQNREQFQTTRRPPGRSVPPV